MSFSLELSPDIKVSPKLERLKTFKQIIAREDVGFFNFHPTPTDLDKMEKCFLKHKDKKHFIHIGIGGSSLGPEMVISALKPKQAMSFIFINNIDSEQLHYDLEGINLNEAIIYIVSKSGTTAETMAAFSILLSLGQFKTEELKHHFIFCTDPEAGDLRLISKQYEIDCFDIPKNIGGRFSVMTAVGLLPAYFAQINIQAFLQGLKDMRSNLLAETKENPLLIATEALLNLKEKGFNQTVLMPYSSRLRNLSFWFVQLWAESLGKEKNSKGEIVFEGLTPIPAYGATDQHSQVQLFMEGPKDKTFILYHIKQFTHNYSLSSRLDVPSMKKLSHFSLNQLMEAEFQGTKKALIRHERPFLHIVVEKNDAYHLAQTILFFESLTALIGQSLAIDPFNQPGVEDGKKFAWEWLSQNA